MPELAKAYVQIIPSAEGIKGNLSRIMDSEAESAGQSSGSSFSSGFSKTIGAVTAVGAAALGAAATAAGKLVKDAVASYADFEQLSGGVETLFGRSAYVVEDYAKNAYKTAGLTANEYMETVTSFSASLLQSLDGDTLHAAWSADQAIKDMSDNANKMGTSMESIQTAYQGFAKQNYTMLDNLKLGYGGTKEEMQRLLSDATKLSGIDYDISSLSDVYEAIHVVQTELGITGTTAAESSSTISGSLGTMKAVWENLVTGIANPDADLSSLIGNVVESATAAAGNLIPAIETGLSGIGQLITGLAPVITGALPSMISGVLPGLVSTAQSLVMTTAEALISNLPLIAETGISLLSELASSISGALPELVPVAIDAILQLVNTLTDPGNLNSLIDSALAIIMALANGLISALPQLLAQAPVIISHLVTAVVQAAPQLLSAALELVVTLASGIIDNLGQIFSAAGEIVSTIWSGITSLATSIWDIGKNIVEGIWQGISNGFEWIKEKISGWITDVLDFFKSMLGIASPSKVFSGYGLSVAQGFGLGIEDGIGDVESAMGDMSDAAIAAWKADQLSTSLTGTAAYQFSGPNAAMLGGASESTDIMSAIFAVGNMIVEAVNNQDSGVYLDGAAVAERLYQHNLDVQLRHGATMII